MPSHTQCYRLGNGGTRLNDAEPYSVLQAKELLDQAECKRLGTNGTRLNGAESYSVLKAWRRRGQINTEIYSIKARRLQELIGDESYSMLITRRWWYQTDTKSFWL